MDIEPGMVKCIDPAGWKYPQPVMRMIKVSSRGLVGFDRTDFIKVAGDVAPAFLDIIDNVKFAKDEVPVHTLAMGSTEFWGANRNGDGFKEATLRQYHKTFEKFARWYRNHKNKDPAISYGTVKASVYSDVMHRVELLNALNATKEAAERNGGFVADRELEKLAKGQDLSVSMACRVPGDICSGCNNFARTRADYCTAEQGCKYGGCRDNLGQLMEDGHVLHVDNPEPSFFDISDVWRPADRTAYAGKADWLQKAASGEIRMGGAELAELMGVTAPLEVMLGANVPVEVIAQIKLAQAMAIVEKEQDAGLNKNAFDALATGDSLTPDQVRHFGEPGSDKAAGMLNALADRKVIISLSAFAAWNGQSKHAGEAARMLPSIYTRLSESGDLDRRLLNSRYMNDKAASSAQQIVADGVAADSGLSQETMQKRAWKSVLSKRSFEKVAAMPVGQGPTDPAAVALAEEYAVYKLAALCRIAGFDTQFDLTARLAVGQNKIW